ncbi:diacylglycerol/lipid kinase family protein [Flavobacterium muglaense]|uniref:Diacylglycerol kinase n=1 Tax=Flavobacterium muglaense TaxID=2764716 RepID=A0A923SE34_9FLAO|nr:diacylglycerol kinase family protein [Flavobacterium muglaense]MBC5836450.1 diacylglycerol kinase [Flavobacterium muglaense]MBC5842980.1 diacylglycerol kinase [Flavobacterium muglaense]
MKKYVLLIVNPISGGLEKSDIIQETAAFVEKIGRKLVIYETSGKKDIPNIQELFTKFNPERVIIAGGDGTIKVVAEALENEDIIFGILPAGSANGLATDLNLLKTIHECLQIAFKDYFIAIDMIEINGANSLHLSDLGLNAELIKNYENSAVRGKIGYALQAVTTLIEREDPFTAVIHVNGTTIECVAQMIVIANSKKYGTGVVINPSGLMDDGKFELIILKNLDLVVLGKIISGNMPIDVNDIQIISSNKANIAVSRPVNFQIDGEYRGLQTELNINISPKKIKIAIP